MNSRILAATLACLLTHATIASAATIEGEYVEARTCNVYTGPCFANGEIGLAGKEAVMAWQVDRGEWQGVKLDGLGVALVLAAEGTLGDDGVFDMKAGKIESIILVDSDAGQAQHAALVAFVKHSAKELTKHVRDIQRLPIALTTDHLSGRSVFTAGKTAKIETRKLKKGDCVCSNEIVFYQPLTTVENAHPAYTLENEYQGKDLGRKWIAGGERGAFLATFRQ